jgi:hypothetical protein
VGDDAGRAVRAIREFAFPGASDDLFADPLAIAGFGVPPHRIEILNSISGLRFEDRKVSWCR